MEGNFPLWEAELRTLVQRAIKERIIANMASPEWRGMWPRTGGGFAETQSRKFLDEAWEIFPAWKTIYEQIDGIRLKEAWDTLHVNAKEEIARSFQKYFYEMRGMPSH